MTIKPSVRHQNEAHTILEVMITGGGIMHGHHYSLTAFRRGHFNEPVHRQRVQYRDEHWVGQERGIDLEKSAQIVEASRQFFLEVERRIEMPENVVGWVFVEQFAWCLITDQHAYAKRAYPLGSVPGLCQRHSGDGLCPRPVEPGSLNCKMHNSHLARHEAKRVEQEERSRERREQMERDAQAREYTRELWEMACDVMEIEPERRGEVRGNVTRTDVDTEVIQTMLRRIIDRA